MAIKGLDQFTKEVKAFSMKVVPEQFVLFQKKMGLDLLRRVVLKTPVDTGRARGNWQVTINTSTESEVQGAVADIDKDKSKVRGSKARAARSFALERGSKEIAKLKPFQALHLYNNVPYIAQLEAGTSKQAPHGMVALSVQELLQVFK